MSWQSHGYGKVTELCEPTHNLILLSQNWKQRIFVYGSLAWWKWHIKTLPV